MEPFCLLMLASICGLTSAINNNVSSGNVTYRYGSNNEDIQVYTQMRNSDKQQMRNRSSPVETQMNDTDSQQSNRSSLVAFQVIDNNIELSNKSALVDSTSDNVTRGGFLDIRSISMKNHDGNNGSKLTYSDTNNSTDFLNNKKLNDSGLSNATVRPTMSSISVDANFDNNVDPINSDKLNRSKQVNKANYYHLTSSPLTINGNGSIQPSSNHDGSIQAGSKFNTDTFATSEVEVAFKVLEDVSSAIGFIFPEIEPITTVLSGIFGFFSSLFGEESEILNLLKQEMKLMKHEFGEINMKLDTITKDLDQIENLIVDSNLKSAYIVDENAILNGFLKLNALIDELDNVSCSNANDCERKRTDIEARFLPYLDVSRNMDNIYRGAMDKTTVFSEPLLDHINKTYECDVPKIKTFTDGIVKLAFKEQQVTMVFNTLSGSSYSITKTLKDWMKRMFKLRDYSKQITRQCLDNIKYFMLTDIRAPKYQSGYNTNYEAVKALRNYLMQKYNWLDWVVIAFDTNKDTSCNTIDIDGIFWSFPGINKGRRNIIASFVDKGTFKSEVKDEIAENLNAIATDKGDFITGLKNRGAWKYIKSITILEQENNWHYAKDSNHYERILEQTYGSTRLFITLRSQEERLFFKSDEERISLVRCNLPCEKNAGPCKQCLNDGVCNHLPYSTTFFCDCQHYFYGQYCQLQSNISIATNLEEMFNHTMKIPKLNDVYFEIKDLSSYIGTSLGNIREAIDKVSATIGKAFVQLHEILSDDFRLIGIASSYGEQITSLQYYIKLFENARGYNGDDNDSGMRDLAEAVLGAQRYSGIRQWLNDFNDLINGTSGFTLTPVEPLLITYMDRFKSNACSRQYKDAIDNVWRQLMLLQQRGYMVWIQALHILNEPTEIAVRQYKDYTSSQIETMEAKTCNVDISGSIRLNCSGGYYLNKRIELQVSCQPNYYLVGNATFTCSNMATSSCYYCNCSSYGALSQDCEDQTGKCQCNSTYYGNKCENKDCVWSSWGAWSVCPCGYANQTRNRSTSDPKRGAGICQGESTETRPCFQGCCSHEFHCNQSKECIPESQHCNHKQDCLHDEDEIDCCETKHTPWYNNGGGNTWDLSHHHIDCGSPLKMVTKFRLEASSYPKQLIRYNYVCCQFSAPFCERIRLVKNTATEGSDQLIYLDKQKVDCGKQSVINSFRLNGGSYGTWYYQYKCCDIKPAFQRTCQENNSPWTTQGSAKSFFLDRQDFQCQNNSYLSYFHLERNFPGHNMIRYNYRCCYVY